MRKPISAVSLASALLLTACVTINIYFPAAAAEQAADKIIKEIQETAPTGEGEPQSMAPAWRGSVLAAAAGVLEFLVPPAQAAGADLSIDSPVIRRIQASMKGRFDALLPYYSRGFIGIGRDGFLVVRDIGQVPLKDRNQVKRLVAAENADRRSLYRAIADANGHPEWRDEIQSTFAKRWIGNARSGWWYQAPNGSWRQK